MLKLHFQVYNLIGALKIFSSGIAGKFDFSAIDSNFVNKIVETRSMRRAEKKSQSKNPAAVRNKSLPWWAVPETTSTGPRLNGIYNERDLTSIKVLSSDKFRDESRPKSHERRRWHRRFSALWKAKEFLREELEDRKVKANQIEPVKENFEYKIKGKPNLRIAKKVEAPIAKVLNSKGLIDYGHYLKSNPQLLKEKFIGRLTIVIPPKSIKKPKIANNFEDSKFHYVPKRLRSKTNEKDYSVKKK